MTSNNDHFDDVTDLEMDDTFETDLNPSLPETMTADSSILPDAALLTDDEPDFVEAETVVDSAGRTRKAVVPPASIPEDMSVFDYLRKCDPPLDKKIIDIACSQSQVPQELKDDAAQEIALMWSRMRPDTSLYKPGQIASYAHRMARHAALHLRRELGSAVRLPGSAFRKRKDGSSYVSPGVLATALDWNELESWFQTDELSDGGLSSALSSDLSGLTRMLEEEAAVSPEESEESLRKERLKLLLSRQAALTKRQVAIMVALIEGATYEEVMAEQNIKKGVLMREVAVASSVLGPFGI